MQITGQEYCKNCHKYTAHTTSLDPRDQLRCSVCKTVYTREQPSKSNQRMHRRRIRKRAEKQETI